jgi:hypothetical protein
MLASSIVAAGPATGTPAGDRGAGIYRLQVNTNLEQISDSLTRSSSASA